MRSRRYEVRVRLYAFEYTHIPCHLLPPEYVHPHNFVHSCRDDKPLFTNYSPVLYFFNFLGTRTPLVPCSYRTSKRESS